MNIRNVLLTAVVATVAFSGAAMAQDNAAGATKEKPAATETAKHVKHKKSHMHKAKTEAKAAKAAEGKAAK